MKLRLFLFIVVGLSLMGCSPKIIEHTIVKSDTCYIERMQRDSIFVKDSTYVSELHHGDTVRIFTDRWHVRWRERIVMDTSYISYRDTVEVKIVKTVTVTEPVPRWKKSLMWIGGILVVYVIGITSLAIYKYFKE